MDARLRESLDRAWSGVEAEIRRRERSAGGGGLYRALPKVEVCRFYRLRIAQAGAVEDLGRIGLAEIHAHLKEAGYRRSFAAARTALRRALWEIGERLPRELCELTTGGRLVVHPEARTGSTAADRVREVPRPYGTGPPGQEQVRLAGTADGEAVRLAAGVRVRPGARVEVIAAAADVDAEPWRPRPIAAGSWLAAAGSVRLGGDAVEEAAAPWT
jgi:hypothetical protein